MAIYPFLLIVAYSYILGFVLRELPDNILTNELLSKFEDASSIKDNILQEETFSHLIRLLPVYNRILLSWLMLHMDHVIEKVFPYVL